MFSFAKNRMFASTRKRVSTIAILAVISLAIFTFLVNDSTRTAEAQDNASPSEGVTLVAFDASLAQLEDIEAAQLAANLLVANTNGGLLFVGRYTDHAEGPVQYSSADEAKSAVNAIVDDLKAQISTQATQANMSEMLERYSDFLGRIDGVDTGKLFVLSAGRFSFHESSGLEGGIDLSRGLAERGIEVSTISLATTPTADRDALAAISDAGGGVPYDLGFLGGVIEFINFELDVQLSPSLETTASEDSAATLNIDVPPHSSYLVAGFAFEDSESTNVLEQPSGQVIEGSVGSVNEFSIEGFKFFTVRNPEPGLWKLKSSGGSGSLTFFSDVINDLGVFMAPQAPFPIGEAFVITAEARSGQLPLIDAAAIIDAIVTGPGGDEQRYELNDRGEDGDVFSEDGTFSSTIGPQQAVGVSEVSFSMRWPHLSATIEGAGAFATEPFPIIEINLPEIEGPIIEGEKTLLATVDLKLGEFPFLAGSEDVSVSVVNATDGSSVDFELEPTEIVDDKVYQLNVFATLTVPGEYEFDAILDSTHLERGFTTVAAKRSQSIEITVPVSLVTYVLIGAGAFVLFIFLLFFVRALLQHNPFGSLYRLDSNGERELVASFSDYKRSPWDWLVNKPMVPAAALPGIPLLGGRFVFSSRGLAFRYRPDSDGLLRMTVRGEALQTGDNFIADNEEFQIGTDTFVFDRMRAEGDVRVSDRIRSVQQERHAELETFALDPMTWDAPSSARPTRRRY